MAEPDPAPGDVTIRDVQDADLEPFFEHQSEPEAVRMAAFPARDRATFMAHWAKIRADPDGLLQTVTADGIVAGNVVSWEQSGRHQVGYWIAREQWGRGIATRALALFLGRERSRPLYAVVAVHNAGSIRVLEKCGFQRQDPAGGVPVVGADEVEEVELVLPAAPGAPADEAG
jgi:RimJ/RimL family protein N-acetyltransferase